MHGLHSRVRATRLVECIVPATSTWQFTCTLSIEMCLFACVSVCVSGIVGYYSCTNLQEDHCKLVSVPTGYLLVPFLMEAHALQAPVRFPYSWTTVPPRTNLTLVPFNGLTSGKSGWCTWNTSRFARPWRKTYPIPHDTPCDGSQNPVCSHRAELSPCQALHLCEQIQYVGPNGPFEHHLEGLRFRFSFMVTWPSTAFASGL